MSIKRVSHCYFLLKWLYQTRKVSSYVYECWGIDVSSFLRFSIVIYNCSESGIVCVSFYFHQQSEQRLYAYGKKNHIVPTVHYYDSSLFEQFIFYNSQLFRYFIITIANCSNSSLLFIFNIHESWSGKSRSSSLSDIMSQCVLLHRLVQLILM